MFKQWKEKRELKMDKLRYEVFLLGALSELVLEFKKVNENKTDILDVVEKLKDVDQKDIVNALVDAIKSQGESGE